MSAKPRRWGSCVAMRAGSGTQVAAAAAATAAAEGAACCGSPPRLLLGAAERLRNSAAVTPLVAPPEPETGRPSPAMPSAAASRKLCESARVGMAPAVDATPDCEVSSARAADAAPGLLISGAPSVSTGESVSGAGGAAGGLATAGVSGCTASAGDAVDGVTGSSCRRREHVVQLQRETIQAFVVQALRPRFEGVAR